MFLLRKRHLLVLLFVLDRVWLEGKFDRQSLELGCAETRLGLRPMQSDRMALEL